MVEFCERGCGRPFAATLRDLLLFTAVGDQLPIQLVDKVFRPQVGVTFQHLHRFVPADGGDFLIAEACFNQPTDGFMTQIVKTQVLNPQLVFDFDPDTVEAVAGW